MKEQKAPHLVTISIITTTTIIFWIFFEVYRIFTGPADINVPDEIMAPITPALDINSLENIERRVFFEEDEIPEFITIPSPAAEATPPEGLELAPTPTATESAEIEEAITPTATPTGSLLP